MVHDKHHARRGIGDRVIRIRAGRNVRDDLTVTGIKDRRCVRVSIGREYAVVGQRNGRMNVLTGREFRVELAGIEIHRDDPVTVADIKAVCFGIDREKIPVPIGACDAVGYSKTRDRRMGGARRGRCADQNQHGRHQRNNMSHIYIPLIAWRSHRTALGDR